MKIELREITVRELADGYKDNDEAGVVGYSGKLDIRPPYQREFVYKDAQRDAVIETITNNFPLNVMYWAVRTDDGFEVIDGQQRTISICQYVDGDFSYEGRYFHNLHVDEQDQILDYKLMVYLCTGPDSEKLAWFKTINIAGEKLTDQELRNAVYSGSWVTAAKAIFSKTNCVAYQLASDYMKGAPIRQDYLETVISWLAEDGINNYMAAHQHDPNATAEWLYFQKVIAWVKAAFPTYRREMKGLPWGLLYNAYGEEALDAASLEAEVASLMGDDEVTNKRGIYTYVLSREERHLSLRTFSDKDKREAYERQKGICPKCKEHYEYDEMQADHVTPWSKGGKTIPSNCKMLCAGDNRRKSNV